jgi:predicted amidohydrolase YtcJ
VRHLSCWIAASTIVLGAASLSARASNAQKDSKATADIVLVNGRVFTADPSRPWADGLAIRGDRVIGVGNTSEILALADAHTKRVDVGGRVVIPGFNDAHNHLGAPLPGVAFTTSDDPVPDPSLRDVLDSLTAVVRRVPPGTWLSTDIDARMLDDTHARRDAIDSVAPAHPVILTASTGHGVILNSAALRALHIRDDAPDPLGGFYERQGAPYPGRGSGRVTGLLHEYAGWNALRALRSQQPESVLVTAFRRRASRALEMGITSIQDMANALDPATTFRVIDAARLPIRVRVIAMPMTDSTRRLTSEWRRATHVTEHERTSEPRVTVSGAKWILDGTGIERMSLLRAPFRDRAGWNGQLNFPIDTLRAILREAVSQRSQPVLHVIGDSAIAVTLATMESVAPESTWRQLRPRFEHAEWLTPDLRARARRMGVVVVENPTHFTDGPGRMRARFGDARSPYYQPFGSLVTDGIPLAIGSDGPLNPFLNLQFAVTHPDNPREALTREQAVVAYTRGSAYAEHAERVKGTLAPGFLADLAILSQDIFAAPDDRLPETVSVMTIVGGRIAYDAGVLSPGGASGAARPTRPPR